MDENEQQRKNGVRLISKILDNLMDISDIQTERLRLLEKETARLEKEIKEMRALLSQGDSKQVYSMNSNTYR